MKPSNDRPEPDSDHEDQTFTASDNAENDVLPRPVGRARARDTSHDEGVQGVDTTSYVIDDTMMPLQSWPPDAYSSVVDGPGSRKLSRSSVAPLVAAARGYRHVEEADVPLLAKMLHLGAKNSSKYRDLISTLEVGNGAMLMPRYKPAAAKSYPEERGQLPFVDLAEFKPVIPITNPTDPDKPLKYKTLKGDHPVLDVHPATPPEWLDHTQVVLITEGVLKGDSGLTAMLRRAGVSEDDLSTVPTNADGTANQSAAVDKLRRLMRTVAENKTFLMVSLGGVTNWHANPEWNDINFKGRTAWVAFDGDVAGNRNVHREASKLWGHLKSKKARPVWLDLTVVRDDDGTGKPLGLDDYLSTVGPWETLPGRLAPTLPDQPAAKGHENVKPEDWWIDDANARALVKAKDTDRNTGAVRYVMQPASEIAGRVVSLVEVRSADDAEVQTATISEDVPDRTNVTIELSWVDEETRQRRTALVTGPDDILVEQPADWHKSRVGAQIPSAVKQHPDWPPPLKWLQAVKANRREETVRTMQWSHMGWVPTEIPGEPVFIVGRQVIGREGFTDRANPGITDRELGGAFLYGVSEPADDESLAAVIEEVLDRFTAAWNDKRHAAAALAFGLRPTVPLVCNTPGSLLGNKGTSKSWTAAAAMQFWQHRPGTWTNNRLPGSASDTAASTEMAISRTPIWVIDDLAPSPDERSEKMEAKKLDATIRAVYNRTAKRRATADMGSRETHIPRAVLMVTGENNRFTASAESRYILMSFSRNSLVDDKYKDLEEMGLKSTWASQITFALIRMFASGSYVVEPDPESPTGIRPAQDQTWERVVQSLEAQKEHYLKVATDAIPGGNARAAGTAADMCMGLHGLEQLCKLLNLPDRVAQIKSMYEQIISLVSDHVAGQTERSPGAVILQAVRSVLRAGQAHIASVDAPGASPIAGTQNSGFIASRLGWLPDGDGGLRPGGQRIGYLMRADEDDPVIVLDAQNAFTIAARHNRDLVLYGSTATQSWKSAWDEELTCPDGQPWKRLIVKGHKRVTVRATENKMTISGIPFRLSTLLSDEFGQVDGDSTDTETEEEVAE